MSANAGDLAPQWSMPGAHYSVDFAPTGRAKCKDFQCKLPIEQGSLRFSIIVDEDDHYGCNQGNFHPQCLFRSMTYRKNKNPRIENPASVAGFADLDDEAKDNIRRLMRGGVDLAAPTMNAAAIPGTVSIKVGAGEVVVVGGNTFPLRARMRELGGTWDGSASNWRFNDATALLAAAGLTRDQLPKERPCSTLAARSRTPAADDEESSAGAARPQPRAEGTPAAASSAPIAPVELVADLDAASKATLTRLCDARGVAKSGTKADQIARLKAAASTGAEPPAGYRKAVYSMVSTGALALPPGKGAADLPWDVNGDLRPAAP